MTMERPLLQGQHIRLEPLDLSHADGLVAASASDSDLYRWSPVPRGKVEVERYIETALSWQDAGTALPFALVRATDGLILRVDPLLESRVLGLAAESSLPRSQGSRCLRNRLHLARQFRDSDRCKHCGQASVAASCFRGLASPARAFSHRCTQPAVARGAGADRRSHGRNSAVASHGRRLYHPRLGAVFDPFH